jgi:ssDNA-binding Zn-finger/Zn-ribbon topoisomerase 1
MEICGKCGGELIVRQGKRKNQVYLRCPKCRRTIMVPAAEAHLLRGQIDGSQKEGAPQGASPAPATPAAGPAGVEPGKPGSFVKFLEWD